MRRYSTVINLISKQGRGQPYFHLIVLSGTPTGVVTPLIEPFCLVPSPYYLAQPMRFGSRGPSELFRIRH